MSCQEGEESDDNLVQHVRFSLPKRACSQGQGRFHVCFQMILLNEDLQQLWLEHGK